MTHSAQSCKRRKMNSEAENHQIKLTDLNADCLRKIFKHLDESHLLNLVDANLTDYHDDQLEKIFNSETNENTHPYEATIRDRFLQFGLHIFSNDPAKMSHYKRIFRYFASLILKITLEYDTQFSRYNFKIEKLILEHCASHVVSVKLVNADKYAFEDIDKPFTQVKEVSFKNGYLSKTLSQFNRWFPKMNSLNVHNAVFLDRDFIEVFPNLKVFSVKLKQLKWYEWTRDYALTNLNFKTLTEMNPQLKKLRVTSDQIRQWDISKDTLGNQPNPNLNFFRHHVLLLRYLKLYIYSDFDFPLETIQFEHLNTLAVATHFTDKLSQLNINCEHLVELRLYVSRFNNYQTTSDLIGRFKNLKSLLCYGYESSLDVSNQHFTTAIKGLLNLQTLHITLLNENNLSNYLFHCIREFDQLTTIKMNCWSLQDYETILNGINENDLMKKNKWKGILGRNSYVNISGQASRLTCNIKFKKI